MTVKRITTEADVVALATGLLDPTRDRPWGVFTIPVDADYTVIDIEYLHDQVGDVCQVYTINTGPLTHQLDNLLPERCQVYGGASRIYPTGTEWHSQPEKSPLRFVHHTNQAANVTETLIADALGMASLAGLFAEPAATSIHATGTVRTILAGGSRAMIELDTGGYATIVHELTFPDIPLDWIVRETQRVEGQLDPKTKRLAPDLNQLDHNQLLEKYPHGTVTLAYVVSVDRQSGVLAVHPSVPITVPKHNISSNPHDRVDLLLAPGDVVYVRTIRNEQGRLGLRLSDIDDSENVQPAMPLTPGGDPWLIEDRHKPEPEREQASPEASAPIDRQAEPEPQNTEPPAPDETSTAVKPAPGTRQVTTQPVNTLSRTAATEPGERSSTALQTTQLALEHARARIRELEREQARLGNAADRARDATLRLELGELSAENRRLQEQNRSLRTDQQAQRAMLRKTRNTAATSPYENRRQRFDSDESWLRHETYLAWIERMDNGDRTEWPLPADYAIGQNLAESLQAFDDTTRDKALKAIVDVLTGRARELPVRSPHPLRKGTGSTAEDLVRSDGARCMRVHIEKNVASARRLHYWVHEGGRIELSRVVLHDDMEP